MSEYKPPIKDMLFILYDALGFSNDDLDRDTIEAILDEAAKLASDVLAPLNKTGDKQGVVLDNNGITCAHGFKDAYKLYCDGGWNSVPFDDKYGGQNLPWALAFAIQEMWQGANMSFGLCPLLNQGAVEAIYAHGSGEQKDKYLPKLISGEWAGTMNLTENQAGSDLGAIKTKAVKQDNGGYKIYGQKIFITYGDHDLTENIIHLVLARIEGAPDGVRGISLFIVPKILDDGESNSVKAIGIEHKLGIHASPTCTMDFDSATGYLVGEQNMGLQYMFTMMNNARLNVGLQGVAIAERAYQHAYVFAHERVQGKSLSDGKAVTIARHRDVRRMLMDMRARICAGRLMTYQAAINLDEENSKRVDFLTPIVKSWCTDMSVDVASTGIQIHGGAGFIEESGAAQYYRDARILPIYEGTNGIQSSDLVSRKILRDDGMVAKKYIAEMKDFIDDAYLDNLASLTDHIIDLARNKKMDEIAWLATPYLKSFGCALGGYFLNKSLSKDDSYFKEEAEFYKNNILPTGLAIISKLC